MLATRIIPTFLYRGANLYKGERFQSSRIVGNAMQAARIYNQRGVDELIMLDIGATPEGRGPDLKMVEQLATECFCPLTVGGGVRSVEDVKHLMDAGADKVAVKMAAIRNTNLIRDISDKFGSQAIVASVDVYSDGSVDGDSKVCWYPHQLAVRYAELGAGEILLTAIDREGTMQGYDLDLIRSVSQAVSIPVIAHGGCGTYQNMLEAIQAGASAVAAGAMFQFTDQTPHGAAKYLHEHGIEVRL